MSSRSVLVVAAHSDDETLGCGATIHRHHVAGDRVAAIHLTDGVGARATSADRVAERVRASDEAAAALGFEWVRRGSFPDNQLDAVELLSLVKFIEAAIGELRPDLVYTHHGADLNIDHRLTFRATLTATRPLPGATVTEVRTFEVPSSTEWSSPHLGPEFRPTLYVDVGPSWDAKLAALRAYSPELRPPPHPRSLEAIDALARWRGAQSGLERSEAFEVVRRIVRRDEAP